MATVALDSTSLMQPRHGVLTLSGFGLRVAVDRGHLVVEYGIGTQRRRGRFSRVSRDLKRLIVLGHAGMVSFEALRWLHDVGTAFVQIGANGDLIAAAGPVGLNEPRLRRAQALAAQNGVGLAIARNLLHEKLAGQVETLRHMGASDEAAAAILAAQQALPRAVSSANLRVLEANAAGVYWDAWRDLPVRFARRDESRVPAHWRTFGARGSLLTGVPRKATNPANALLNYLYAIVEAEARLAALAVGCDPGLGLLHADIRSRDSLACDLMEPVRPAVDRFVIDTLSARVFRREEFFETREGVCRVLPPVTLLLAQTATRWAKALAPVAERVARRLADSIVHGEDPSRPSRPIRLPTPLTEAKRRAGRRALHDRGIQQPPHVQLNGLEQTCQICGAALRTKRQRFCDQCRPSNAERFAKGHAVLRQMQAEGRDPSRSDSAVRASWARRLETHRAISEWEATHPRRPDSAVYFRDVFPRVQAASVPAIVRATGLCYPYSALIRRGVKVPHPRHWEALVSLVSNR